MKTVARALWTLLLAGLLAVPVAAQSEEADEGDGYRSGDFGRIRYEENGVTIFRAEDAAAAPSAGMVNAPLFPGDTLETAADQRVEVQLADGALIRLDGGSRLTLLALPASLGSYRDNTVLQLAQGVVRVSTRVDDDVEFRIDTAAASVYLLSDGDFRLEIDSRGRTEIYSWRGVAEIAGDGGSMLVRAGMRSHVDPGGLPADARSFNTLVTDGFDRWVARREEANRYRDEYSSARYDRYGDDDRRDYGDDQYDRYDDQEVYDDLPIEVRPYYRELSRSGRWVYVADYGYCWYPLGVGTDWRPYRVGSWSYGSRGYFWVSNEPWGWAPYHYGRWNWVGSYGWCWIPGRVFSGAWVSWSWGSAHIGWSPLDYWNRPAFIGNVVYGYYDPRCWTFLSYTHFGRRNHHRYAVPIDRIGRDIARHAVVRRAPRISPRRLASDPGSRTRAYREAGEHPGGRIARIDRTRAPGRNFRESENRLGRRIAESPDGREVERTPRVPSRERRVDRSPDRERARPLSTVDRDRGEARGSSRRMPERPSGIVRSSPRDGRSSADRATPRSPRKDVPPPSAGTPRNPRRIAPRSSERRGAGEARPRAPVRSSQPDRGPGASRGDTSERLRDMYREMARPRQTRDRRESTADRETPSGGNRPTSRPSASPTRRRSEPPRESVSPGSSRSRPSSARAPRGGSGSRPSSARAPRGGSGSRPSSARAPRGGSGSRPSSARAPRGGSGSRPSSARAPRGGSGSRPSSARAPRGGSGSRPSSARAPRGGSGSRPSSARAPRGGSGSRPSSARAPRGGSGSKPSSARAPRGGSGSKPSSARAPRGGSGSKPSARPARGGSGKSGGSSGRKRKKD